MKVLCFLAALVLFTGCTEEQQLTGPWEMWVLVCRPADGEVWQPSSEKEFTVSWAAVPGETVRCDLMKNGRMVMELSNWVESGQGSLVFRGSLTKVGSGSGYQVRVLDEQGFYGLSGEFTIR